MSTAVATIDKTLEDCAYKIELAQTSTVWNVIEIGKALHDAREAIRADGSRCFASWAKERVGISKSGAYRAIAVYERFGNRPTLGRLEVSEACMLAMDGVPDAAIDQAIEESERQDEPLGRKRIEEIKDEHRVPVVHDTNGEPDDGPDDSEGESPTGDGVQRREVAEAARERESSPVVNGGRSVGSPDGDDQGVRSKAPTAKAAPQEPNIIGDAIRQVTMELEFATETLADFQVQAVYEGVRLWMAEQREKRGIKC